MAASGDIAREIAGDYPINPDRKGETMTIPISHDVRQLLDAPNYVHLPTVRADGSPQNWVVWVGPDRVCFAIVVENAARPTRAFVQDPPLGGALDRGRT